MALLGSGLGCAGRLRRGPNEAYLALRATAPGRAVLGVCRDGSPEEACRRAVAHLSDLSWLRRGDSVFVKVASNSDQPHPAVTWPPAVGAMVALLRANGAGTIYVGDQAGVEHVRLTAAGRVSATRAVMAANGLLAAIERAGATVHNFDDHGWEGYYRPALDCAHHWEEPPRVAKILAEVDHVVYLPRLGTHAVAGYTCGIKLAVGWLRDDSRRLLHQRNATFFEKIAELAMLTPIRDKLRLVVTLGTHALLNIGPDFGSHYDFGGQLVLAATNLFDHDALAAAVLPWLDRHDESVFDLYRPYPSDVDFWSRGLVAEIWGPEALADYEPLAAYPLGHHLALDPCLSRLAVITRRRPGHIDVMVVGDGLPEGSPTGLAQHLERFSGRPFRLRRGPSS